MSDRHKTNTHSLTHFPLMKVLLTLPNFSFTLPTFPFASGFPSCCCIISTFSHCPLAPKPLKLAAPFALPSRPNSPTLLGYPNWLTYCIQKLLRLPIASSVLQRLCRCKNARRTRRCSAPKLSSPATMYGTLRLITEELELVLELRVGRQFMDWEVLRVMDGFGVEAGVT